MVVQSLFVFICICIYLYLFYIVFIYILLLHAHTYITGYGRVHFQFVYAHTTHGRCVHVMLMSYDIRIRNIRKLTLLHNSYRATFFRIEL